jgi:hypothetical protein
MKTSRRRDFLKQAAAASLFTLATGATAQSGAAAPANGGGVRTRKEPVAIAMWDFSWLLRHDPGREFADWDEVLDGLVKRGYNAIRLDVFPALVASGPDGRVTETFLHPRNSKRPVSWGNQYPTTVNPRAALKEFLPRCFDRGIWLGLSTWFFGPGAGKIQGLDGFVRVWDETLSYLKENDLLHNVYYVDLLNEYPLFSGFNWLRDQMDGGIKTRSDQAKAEGVHEWKEKAGNYNSAASRKFYTDFANDAIARLQSKWPQLDFLFSLPHNDAADWHVMVPTKIAALDVHCWFIHNPLLGRDTGYWQNIHKLAETDDPFAGVQAALVKNWSAHKPELIEWMDAWMGEVASHGRKHDKPVGNTEGWGLINWVDHPDLPWDIIKEAAEICAGLGCKHGYRFNCTSNFTEPQFPRLWADVHWHRKMTAIIRGL